MLDDADTGHVVPTADHHRVARLELHVIQDLPRRQVHTHGIIRLDIWVWVPQRAAVVSGSVWRAFGAARDTLDTAELVGGLILGDLVQLETALGVVKQPET